TADALLRLSLNAGAPDNVTIVLLDVGDDPVPVSETQVVGAASQPLQFDPPPPRRPKGLPALLRQTFAAPPVPESHFEPETDDYLAALILEDRKRLRRRRATAITLVVLSIAAIVVGLIAGYNYTQSRYFIGEHLGKVALYRGVQQDLGPIQLSHLVTLTDIRVEDLPAYRQQAVLATISLGGLQSADETLQELSDAARRCGRELAVRGDRLPAPAAGPIAQHRDRPARGRLPARRGRVLPRRCGHGPAAERQHLHLARRARRAGP